MNVTPKHFLDLRDIPAATLRMILDKALDVKAAREDIRQQAPLKGCALAMIFEKNSTRTRVSFEVGMHELGGHAVFLSGRDSQLGRGETIADTARVLSRYVSAIMIRCHDHDVLLDLAKHSSVPVINGLTQKYHPCQLMADILTFEEKRGPIAGKVIAWVGDGNNMANSWITAAVPFGFTLRLACPEPYTPDPELIAWAKAQGADVELVADLSEAVKGAHAVVTDTWVSMGDTDADMRMDAFKPYQVNSDLMKLADSRAIFLHCLPAHREEEVTSDVIDGPQSAVWDEAENRLHVQKAILLWCTGRMY